MAFTVQPLEFSAKQHPLAVERTLKCWGSPAEAAIADIVRRLAEGHGFLLGGTRGCGKASLLNEICFQVSRQEDRVLVLGPVSLQLMDSHGLDSLSSQLRDWFCSSTKQLSRFLSSASLLPERLDDWPAFLRTTAEHGGADTIALLVTDLEGVSADDRDRILQSVQDLLSRTGLRVVLGCAGNLLEHEMSPMPARSTRSEDRYLLCPFDQREMNSLFARVASDYGYEFAASASDEFQRCTQSVPYFVQSLMLSLVSLEIPPGTTITEALVKRAAEEMPPMLISRFALPLTSLEGGALGDTQELINMLIRLGAVEVEWEFSVVRNLLRLGLVRRDAQDRMIWATPLLGNWFQKAGPVVARMPWDVQGIRELEERASALRQLYQREEAAEEPRASINTGKGVPEMPPQDSDSEGQPGDDDLVVLLVKRETAIDLINAFMISLGSAPSPKGRGMLVGIEEESTAEPEPDWPSAAPHAPAPPAQFEPPYPPVRGIRREGEHKRAKPPTRGSAIQRYVNLWFTSGQADEPMLARGRALALDREVYLRVNIGAFDPRTIMEEAREFISDAAIAAAFPETVGQPVPLEATIFSSDFEIADGARTQKFELVRGEPTRPFYFPMTPRTQGTARLRLCVFYKNHLLQSLNVEAAVRKRRVVSLIPQTARVELTFSTDFSNAAALPARGLWLGINHSADDTHTLNVKDNERALSRNLENQIETALEAAREALLEVSFTQKRDVDGKVMIDEDTGQPKKDYRFDGENYPKGAPDSRPKRFREDLTTLAAAGRNLYQAVFGAVPTAEEREKVQPIIDEMKTTLRDEQIIQIARLKKMEDIWPWALMYDSLIDPDHVKEVCLAYRGDDGQALPYSEGVKKCSHRDPKTRRNRDKTVVCPYGFWGFKHIIEQPTQPGGKKAFDPNKDLPLEIRINAEPVLQMLLENRLGKIESKHVDSMRELKFKALTSLGDFIATLDPANEPPPPEPHVVYFFCHGKYDAQHSPYLQVGTNESLLPAELDELDFRWENSRGLVFINGCHTAELQPKDLSSLMQPFVEAYASGIIGTEISVATALAREFAQGFFTRFLAGNTPANAVGQIIKDLRLSLLMKYNPLGLVYTPYCSASLQVQR